MAIDEDRKAITSMDSESLYSHDKLSLDTYIPDAPKVITIPMPIKFYDKTTKEKVETFAFEIQCNRLGVTKVMECMQSYHKVDKTCTFIPYGMKHKDTGQYCKWVD